jgi:hypothetical protein
MNLGGAPLFEAVGLGRQEVIFTTLLSVKVEGKLIKRQKITNF